MPINRTILILFLTTFLYPIPTLCQFKNTEKRRSTFLNGDFIIGALFPLHYPPESERRTVTSSDIKCGKIRKEYGIQRVEIALQTLDRINADNQLLPNITLGIEIRDECWYAPVALQQSLELIRDAITPLASLCPENGKLEDARGPLIGVVGPGASSVALQVQNLLQLFHLPQIGYSTTSKDLSDKSRFGYFLRVVPSDFYQAQVMLDIVKKFKWTYVSAVSTNENYGRSGIQAFRELAEQSDVCIAKEESVLSMAKDEVFDKVIMNLRQDPHAVVVVCFCEGLTVRGLLQATKRLNLTNHFLFIGSDGWADRSDVTENYEHEAWGGISVRIHSPRVSLFDDYYTNLSPETNHRNPWFVEFWESEFSCTLPTTQPTLDLSSRNMSSTVKLCTGNESLTKEYHQDAKLSFVIKGIYTFAYALHNMQQDICGHGHIGKCSKLFPFNGSLFKNYLMNVSFEYESETVEFDENGDPPGRYDILNYQKLNDNTFDYVQIGSWNNRSLNDWDENKIQLGPHNRSVRSMCSEECPVGHYKNVQQGGKDKRCCWVCVPCQSGSILAENREKCEACPLGQKPNDLQNKCLELPIEYVQWHDPEAITALFFVFLGFLSTFSTFYIFIKYTNTPVVKSSTKELCFIILFGMTLSHISVFFILMKPTEWSCTLNRMLPGISFSLIYAALLTKTNRIARILAGSKKRFPTKKPMFMSALSQVIITCLLVFVEIVISGFMLWYQIPKIVHTYKTNRTLLECNTTPLAIMTPLAFDFFLIILCTLYAIKTRNVPENFNEAKFIGFAMYTTCVIWIAFIPIYFGSDSKVITFSICVTLSAIVIWVFIFVPKLYIIILKPERNNRALFTTSKTLRCHIGSRVASAICDKSSTTSWRSSTSGRADGELCMPPTRKRTLSCQTGTELLQFLLLDTMNLYEMPIKSSKSIAKIVEKDCCNADGCHMKKIIIQLPEKAD